MPTKYTLQKLINEIQNHPFTKDKQGYGYNYLDLDSIISKSNEILQKGNYVLVQKINDKGLKTDIVDAEMQTKLSSGYLTLPDTETQKGQNLYQSYGSKLTYFKRYQLASLLGINSEEDLDGKVLTREEKKEKNEIVDKLRELLPTLTEEQKTKVTTIVKGGNIELMEAIYNKLQGEK